MQESDSLNARAARSYREEQINGLSQKDLILMLYDGAIKFTSEAKRTFSEKNFAQGHVSITKARNIILELLRILNMEEGGEIARNLQRLYVYMIGRLIEVNFTKELSLLDNVLAILADLRFAWAHIDFAQPENHRHAQENERNGNSRPTPKGVDSARLLSVTA